MKVWKGFKVMSVALVIGATLAIDFMGSAVHAVSASRDRSGTSVSSSENLIARSKRRRLRFRVGVRPSRYRLGGFSRAASCGEQQSLTALVPPPQAQEGLPNEHATVDKTSNERPTFFVSLPSLPATTGQFTLQDEAGTKQLYNVKFQVTGKPGIVGIVLPNSSPALQVGQKYLWQVAVACEPDDPASNIIVSSWIERVNVPTVSGADRIAALAEQGIWQDAVASLALERFQKPQDKEIAEDWASLMEDAGLPQFKQTAIVQLVKN
ncbi:MAG: DUF928 domain-containing protein [Leptolyngbyaceae cyanobacterium bins.59]|nr:DUF928 domain-containing protein [Leptolyngbyaceae cyanobacterium bins.59]